MVAPTLLVLAAGAGSRYGGLKLTDPVGPDGETITEYSLYDARRAGFGRILFVIRRENEQRFADLVHARIGRHFQVEHVCQELAKLPPGFNTPAGRTKPWGTTHAILMAAGVIHEPFAVINVDDFYGEESFLAMAHHLQSGSTDYAAVGFILRNTLPEIGSVARAVCRLDARGHLESITELKNVERMRAHAISTDPEGNETLLTGNEIVSMNMWGFTPQVFPQLRQSFISFLECNGKDSNAECYIPSTVNDLIETGQASVKVLQCANSWFGLTYREDHSRAVESIHRLVTSGYYPKRLWS